MWDGEIVSSPSLIHANARDGTLTVYRSVLVAATGRMYAPVAAILAARCTEILTASEEEDEGMMFGRALLVVRKIWFYCPGPDYPHRCRTAENIDEEVRALCSNQEAAAA